MKNLWIRTLSGLVFLGVMVGGLLGGLVPYACLMIFLTAGMMYEFYTMTLGRKHRLQKIAGIAFGIILWGTCFVLPAATLVLLLIVFVLLLLIVQLYEKDEKPFHTVACTLLGVFYIAAPLMLFNLLGLGNRPALLGLFIILWSSDVGAYVSGMLFGQKGKHKLFPSISPKKSWEGFFGGLLTALAAGYVLLVTGMLPYGLVHVLVISSLISVFGVFGDLVESMLKRSVGVKDSGRIMPGHGGLLDRFDAALFALPVALLYMDRFSLLNL
ncbi:MAG: phosphatidate cytidylyltransferase [Prevotellaceae bacterium]|jgi:phosphatidate cytidylyltransferase|nr:phosphatidate cytidylyltransferase [Prevotellaceae bacterium]